MLFLDVFLSVTNEGYVWSECSRCSFYTYIKSNLCLYMKQTTFQTLLSLSSETQAICVKLQGCLRNDRTGPFWQALIQRYDKIMESWVERQSLVDKSAQVIGIVYFIWIWRSQRLWEEWSGTKSLLLDVQSEVCTADDMVDQHHVICWCWSTLFYQV